MNTTIKAIKEQTLAQLKQQKEHLTSQKGVMIDRRFIEKKKAVDEENLRLDQSYEKYRQEKTLAYQKELTNKSTEVADKKQQNIENAKFAAKTEIEAELAADFMEFDAEIAKLEKELKENGGAN